MASLVRETLSPHPSAHSEASAEARPMPAVTSPCDGQTLTTRHPGPAPSTSQRRTQTCRKRIQTRGATQRSKPQTVDILTRTEESTLQEPDASSKGPPCQEGSPGGEGRRSQESGINVYTPLYMQWMTNTDLLYSPANSTQHFVKTDKEKESLKSRYTSVCDWLTLLHT